jgi:hypothetical protein
MKLAVALASLVVALAGPAEAAARRSAPAKGVVMGPGWAAPGVNVQVHRGGVGAPARAAPDRPVLVRKVIQPVVIVLRPPRDIDYPGYRQGYAPRDWTARRFGQADWSGDSFGGEDFAFGPWTD